MTRSTLAKVILGSALVLSSGAAIAQLTDIEDALRVAITICTTDNPDTITLASGAYVSGTDAVSVSVTSTSVGTGEVAMEAGVLDIPTGNIHFLDDSLIPAEYCELGLYRIGDRVE